MTQTDRPLLFGAIADDLTGGLELASLLTAGGARCTLITDPAALGTLEPGGCDAIVIAQRLRLGPADRAVARARDAAERLLALGARQIFYKYCATFDSTDAGNIGPVVDMLSEMIQAGTVLFCPSFPERLVAVFGGHLFYDTSLISNTEKRFDPATPMLDPDLAAVLRRQSRRGVGVLPLRDVLAGPEAMAGTAARALAAGRPYLIADAVTADNLRTIARFAVEAPLLTGNSSVAEYLAQIWRERGWIGRELPALPPVDGPAAVLAGSCADLTLSQLEHFGQSAGVHVFDLETIETPAQAVAEALAWAETQGAGPLAFATSAPPDKVARIQRRLGREGAADMADAILAGMAEALVARGVRRLLVSGGEASGAVIDRLGLTALDVGPLEQVGVSRAVSQGPQRLAICLKSGKLGPVDMFHRTLEAMGTAVRTDGHGAV